MTEEDLVGQRVGHIRVERFLAAGGMGSVYVGFDEALERRVALKAIRSRERLDPEELVEGRGLDTALDEGLAPPLLERVAEQVAGVLVAAHEAGVVHRDLKPSNVMLTPDGQVKVLDFGLSRLVGDGQAAEAPPAATLVLSGDPSAPTVPVPVAVPAAAPDGHGATVSLAPVARATPRPGSTGPLAELATQHGLVIGTPEYMSPEQARGEPVSPASDVYSFSLLLQRLFTGASPYGAGLPAEELVRRAALGDTRPAEGIDPDLAALIGRMKAPQPGAARR